MGHSIFFIHTLLLLRYLEIRVGGGCSSWGNCVSALDFLINSEGGSALAIDQGYPMNDSFQKMSELSQMDFSMF